MSGAPATATLAAVLLAAGESRRAGSAERPLHKLLIPVGGEPLVRRVARRLCASGVREVVAVVGHRAEEVSAALAGLPLRVVPNPDYRQGQATSVRTGLAALAPGVAGVLICLADQPALEVAHYQALARAFHQRAGGEALVPFVGGQRGNPLVLTRAAAERILERRGWFGCRRFVEENADLVERFEVDDPAWVIDIDGPEDVAAWSPELSRPELSGSD